MPITQSASKRFTKPNGFAVYEFHTDHLGIVHDHRWYHDGSADEAVELAANALKVDAGLVPNESLRVSKFIEEGGDPAEITVVYLTNQQRATAIVRGMMMAENPD